MKKNIRQVITALAKDPELRKRVEGARGQKEKQKILEDAGCTVNFSKEDVESISSSSIKKMAPKLSGIRGPGPLASTVEWVGVIVTAAAAAAVA